MQPFEFFSPKSLTELMNLLKLPNHKVIAGGTDLIPQIRSKKIKPEVLIDLSRLGELDFIQERKEEIRIGALTTFASILESAILRQLAPALVQAAGWLGAPMTRSRATIGGNIANASPAGDSLTPLLTLDARISLLGPHGERFVPLTEFLINPGQTTCANDEIIHHISVVKPAIDSRGTFQKVGPRKGMTIAIANAAVLLHVQNLKIVDVRIALGAVAPTALRCPKAEAFLVNQTPGETIWQEAGRVAASEITPIDDIRGSAQYRIKAATTLLRRALSTALVN